jgi:hypothetical protein
VTRPWRKSKASVINWPADGCELATVNGEGSRPDYHDPGAACPTVVANCRGFVMADAMLQGVAYEV